MATLHCGITCVIDGVDIIIASVTSAAGIAEKPKIVAQSPNNQDPINDYIGDLCGRISGGTGGCAGEAVHIGGVRDVCCCIGKCCDQAVGAVQNRQKRLNLQVTILSTTHALDRPQLLVTKNYEHMILVRNTNDSSERDQLTEQLQPALVTVKGKEHQALQYGASTTQN